MGVWEVLTGQQPLMRPVPAGKRNLLGTSTSEAEIIHAINRPFIPVNRVQTDPLRGTYDSLAASRDYELAKRGSGDLQSIRQIAIDCTVVGEVKGSPFSLGECTGILLAPRVTGDSGGESESSDTARIYVQVNNSGVWIPMSFNLTVQGSQKGDAQFIAGPIATLRVQVVNPTQDTINQPRMFLWAVRGFTIVGQFGAAVGYGPPIAVSGATAVAPVVTPTSGGGGTAGGGGPAGGGGGPAGGGGGTTGGGGTGSGGGGGLR